LFFGHRANFATASFRILFFEYSSMATQGPTVIVHVPAAAAVVAPNAGAASSGIAAGAAGADGQGCLTAGDLLAAATAQFVASGGGGDKVKDLLAQSQDLTNVKKKISKD
jgi:hypothetical protein